MKDKVFSKKRRIANFTFDKEVADVFDDMVDRSVPFYNEIQRMVMEQVLVFVRPATKIYDLGCSTATTINLLAKNIADKSIQFIGIDNSEEMINKAEEKLRKNGFLDRVTLICNDINDVEIEENASVVILNFTLQFVRPLYRDILIRRIYDGLIDGGVLLVSEKVLADNSMLNRLYIDYYYNYKRLAHYSELEISQKREALENILVPYRVSEDIELLNRNGFEIVDIFFKWYNFVGFVAIKHCIESKNTRRE